MARSKNPSNYPEQYGQLLQAAYEKKTAMYIPMSSRGQAMRIRAGLYAFINAVDKQEADRNTPDTMKLSLTYRQVQISAATRGQEPNENHFLALQNKNYTPENIAIAQALEGFVPQLTIVEDVGVTLPSREEVLSQMHTSEVESVEADPHGDLIASLFKRDDGIAEESK